MLLILLVDINLNPGNVNRHQKKKNKKKIINSMEVSLFPSL